VDDTLQRLARALDFVEAHLFEELPLAAIAARTGWSSWHFHRRFVALVGRTPADYVRRRRFAEICQRLCAGAEPLVEIALACGFESQASFTRAFTRQVGTSPGRFRRERRAAPAYRYPPLDVAALAARLERSPMQPRLTHKDAIHAVGMCGRFVPFDSRIPELWARFVPRIGEIPLRRGAHTLGVCVDDADGEGITYLAAVEVERIASVPDGMFALTLPARRYAVWTHRGPLATFPDTVKLVFGRWLAESKLPHAEAPDFEWYDERFDPERGAGEIDVYVPLDLGTEMDLARGSE
jgi:AraC family transcriptional regulator